MGDVLSLITNIYHLFYASCKLSSFHVRKQSQVWKTQGYTAVEWEGSDLNLFSLEAWALSSLLQLRPRHLNF